MTQIRKEISFVEAGAYHAVRFIEFMKEVAQETEFLVLDEKGLEWSPDDLAIIFENSRESTAHLHLLALCENEIIGVVTVRSSSQYRISHIGTVFLAVKKEYWGYGIGRILLEECIEWAKTYQVIKRLELTVQIRNVRAVSLYQHLGFEIEGTQKRGARTDEGEWLDLYYMGLLIDDK